MNDRFVNIKVYREERPDLDQIYQHALALMGEHGGWPLTMFLTPDGEPFWGGTYFPPEPRWGRTGFPQILEAIGNAYMRDREKVTKNVVALREALQRLGRPERGGAIAPEQLDRIAERRARSTSCMGIGTPKFPQTGVLELLWHAGSAAARPLPDAVANALDACVRAASTSSRRRLALFVDALARATLKRAAPTTPNWSSATAMQQKGPPSTKRVRSHRWVGREMYPRVGSPTAAGQAAARGREDYVGPKGDRRAPASRVPIVQAHDVRRRRWGGHTIGWPRRSPRR
jgi:hypothetical protein